MVPYKKIFFLSALLFIGAASFFLYLTSQKPILLEHGQDFPYLEVQLCVDSEASKLIKKIDVSNYYDKDITNSITQSIRKCNAIIEELVGLVIKQVKNEHPELLTNTKQKDNLKTKVEDTLFQEYESLYKKDIGNIIKHANNPSYTQDTLLEAEKENTLDAFLKEKINQSAIEYNNLVLHLTNLITKE